MQRELDINEIAYGTQFEVKEALQTVKDMNHIRFKTSDGQEVEVQETESQNTRLPKLDSKEWAKKKDKDW